MLTRSQKEAVCTELSEIMSSSGTVFVLEPAPMPVAVFEGLRVNVRECGGSVRMVKNTLALRAIAGTAYEGLSKAFSKTSVLMVGDDSLALSKALKSFNKENDNSLGFKGGVVDGKEVSFEMVKALANVPPLEDLRAQLVGVLAAPATRLVRTVSAVPQALVAVLSNKVEKGE